MDDKPAQGASNHYGDGQQTTGSDRTHGQQQYPSAVADPHQRHPVSGTPHKEHAPLSEHVHITDAVEAQPEIHQELKEAGVEAKHDEAHLQLTREHQKMGFQHSPHATPVTSHLTDAKQEFQMSYAQAEEEIKKGSVWNSVRWLAELILKQMKAKHIAEK